MVEILHLFSLVLLPSSSLGDAEWQVLNSSYYCSNSVIYTCVSENSPVINWDILEQGRGIASWSVSHFTNDGRLTRETEPIEAVLQITYSNSTFIASTIILTLTMDPQMYTIKCNKIIAGNIPRSSLTICEKTPAAWIICASLSSQNKRDPLPTTIQITVISNTVSISWNITWHEYVIEEYSGSGEVIRNWTTNNIQMTPFNLSTNTERVKIFVCPNRYIHFTVESCLFQVETRLYIKNHFVLHVNNRTWELTGKNSSKTISTFCHSNGSWENIEFFNQVLLNTSQMNTTTSMLIPQNTQNLTKQGYDTTEENPMDSNSTLAANNLAIILVLSITPVGLVLLISSIILVVIPAGTWTYRKKSSDNNRDLNIETEDAEVATYEQLNNFPYQGSSIAIGTPGHQPPVMKVDSEQDYSTLKHIKQSLPPSMDYDTINGVKPHRYKSNRQLAYAEIHTCTQCGRAKSFEDHKVNYTNICTQEEIADEQLNLHTLSAQLGPILESFIAFGSLAGVSPASLSEIVVKSSSHNESMTEVCDMWLKKCEQEQTRPTWHMVAEILDLIGHKEFSKKLLQQVYVKGVLPVPVDKDSLAKISDTREVSSSSENKEDTENKSKNSPDCFLEIVPFMSYEESWSDEAPPIPPFNPQCLSDPEDMPTPLYEEVQTIASRPLASGKHSQSGPEDVTTFTGASNEVSEAVGMENL